VERRPLDQDRTGPAQQANGRLGRPPPRGARARALGGNRSLFARARRGRRARVDDCARVGQRALAGHLRRPARAGVRRRRRRLVPAAVGSRPRRARCLPGYRGGGRGSGRSCRVRLAPDRSSCARAVELPRASTRPRNDRRCRRRAGTRSLRPRARHLAGSAGCARDDRIRRRSAVVGGRGAGARHRHGSPGAADLRDSCRRPPDRGHRARPGLSRSRRGRPAALTAPAHGCSRVLGPPLSGTAAASARAWQGRPGHATTGAPLALARVPRSTEKRRDWAARTG
jgi:hypothetical protein